MARKNKYRYLFKLYTNYGYGWELECTYDKDETSYAQVLRDAKEYRLIGAQTRITEGRVLNDLDI